MKRLLVVFRAHVNQQIPKYMPERFAVANNCENPFDLAATYFAKRDRLSTTLSLLMTGFIFSLLILIAAAQHKSVMFEVISLCATLCCGAFLIAGIFSFASLRVPDEWVAYVHNLDGFMENFKIESLIEFKEWPTPKHLQEFVDTNFRSTPVRSSLNLNSKLHSFAYQFNFALPWNEHCIKFGQS